MSIQLRASNRFTDVLVQHDIVLERDMVHTLQLNLGYKCNQVCSHCHVDAGPHRLESMEILTIDRVLYLLQRQNDIHTVDLTGGAPELNPHFRYLVRELRHMGKKVIDRCNLTVLLEEGQADTAAFLANYQVDIVASLPCYLEENADAVRGESAFQKSIQALQQLNRLGYGQTMSSLGLNLVYNPIDDSLPPVQNTLEIAYKDYLYATYGISFHQLLTITNMPIKRFAHQLKCEGKYESYLELLAQNFNAAAAKQVMCRSLLSVGWNGSLYDCDFHQALAIPVQGAKTVWEIADFEQVSKTITTRQHCFGCTAGCGSSCGGALL